MQLKNIRNIVMTTNLACYIIALFSQLIESTIATDINNHERQHQPFSLQGDFEVAYKYALLNSNDSNIFILNRTGASAVKNNGKKKTSNIWDNKRILVS